MKECHVCKYMCDDSAEICPVCGAELIFEEKPQTEQIADGTEKAINNPVLAASVDSPVTAEIFKDILSENKIPYSEDSSGDIMHTGFGGSYFAIDIYVDETDLDTAKGLYKNLTENEMSFEDFEDFEGFEDAEDTDGE